MSRSDPERLGDILTAIDRCLRFRSYLEPGGEDELPDMAYDAILRNLAVIGEAARALSDETRSRFAGVPWHSIAGLRNIVIHEYFRIEPEVIRDVVDSDLAPLAAALRSYLGGLTDAG